MTLNEYQQLAHTFVVHKSGPSQTTSDPIYCALGLAGEVGEVIEPLKKWYRGTRALDLHKLRDEMGDVLWYLAELATRLGLTLEEIGQYNGEKLTLRRKERDGK
jgi:NTP pyrophosphatase (non-canonical NTP hydrolase)